MVWSNSIAELRDCRSVPHPPLTGAPNGPIEMSSEQLDAFERLKSCLANATTFAFPSPDAQMSLTVDVSKTAIGAVLNQGEGDNRQPLAFFSKTLIPNQPASSSPTSFPSPAPNPVNAAAATSPQAASPHLLQPTLPRNRQPAAADVFIFPIALFLIITSECTTIDLLPSSLPPTSDLGGGLCSSRFASCH